jgi:hypothetical protein
VTITIIESLPTRKQKREIECDLIKKSAICKKKKQSNDVMLEMMTSKMAIDLNVLSSFMKNQVVSNLNRTLVVKIYKSEMRKGNSHICK